MMEADDSQLLREFAERQSDAAFAALVTRYVNLVYSVALRQTGNPHAAEEITQAVFIILARKAGGLGAKTILSGWLYQTARLTAANLLRGQIRRQQREQEAYMQSLANEAEPDVWPRIAPLLDDALGQLGEHDRHAIVLRYFENRSLGEVGAALGASEDAAKMRVNRALEKLRKFFTKRGVTLTTALIAGAVSANSVQAAPVGLAVTITAAAAKGSTLAASIAVLVKGTMKMMTWMKIKFGIGVGAAALLAGGAATVVLSGDGTGTGLPPSEIFKRAQEKYAALTSYSDEGQTVATLNGTTITTTFTVRLARPNLYRIEWTQAMAYFTNGGVVWSAGKDDFMLGRFEMLNKGGRATKYKDKETALSSATGISGGAAATIPGTFFKMNWGNQLGGSGAGEKRQADQKVGDVDCYVFTSDVKGRTKTIWIGKQDFLIHQVRTVTSAEAMKAAMAEAAKRNPEISARLPKPKPQDITSTETHANIVVNKKFSPKDFAR
jgi:RNA polymerase sigma factor (sigma-70 family)